MSLTTTEPRSSAQHEGAYAYGYSRTRQMTADLGHGELVQYRETWHRRLIHLELGTQAYAVALGAWTSLHHRLNGAQPSARVSDRIRRTGTPGRTRSCSFEAAGGYR